MEFTFKENVFFQLGYPEFSHYTLTISDNLTEPTSWSVCSLNAFFGAWGAVKHGLMIEWTGEPWDDDYIKSLFVEYNFGDISIWVPQDQDYLNYLAVWFSEKLEKANEDRLNNPAIGEKYKESDGQEVSFTPQVN